MVTKRILIIDDQIGKTGSREMRDFLLDYRALADRYEFIFEDAESANGDYSSEEAVQAILDAGNLDLVLLDIKFGSESDRLGFEILERIRNQFRALPVMMMTSLDRDATNLTRSLEPGAVSFISKRPTPEVLSQRIEEAIALARDYAILGNSDAIRKVRREIATVSPYGNVPILILGERGTGKERVAHYIHQNGPRRDRAFVGLNCAGLSAELLEAELYGYLKGAFTGAERDRRGYLEVAEGGTLFLDEMGEIPTRVQVSLLRVLEERKFRPVGGADREKSMDVQIISATNADIKKLIQEGKLREDFLDRISAFVIKTPPLRECQEDIPELASYFLGQVPPGKGKRFSRPSVRLLQAYGWPGNGRQLRNFVWQAAIKSGDNSVIDEDCLPEEVRSAGHKELSVELSQAATACTIGQISAEPQKPADCLSRAIIEAISREAADVGDNAAAIMRNLFPGQNESKRYLGQVAWKIVDWNPLILAEGELLNTFQGCNVLWSAFTSYLSSNPMTRQKLIEKLQRHNVDVSGLF